MDTSGVRRPAGGMDPLLQRVDIIISETADRGKRDEKKATEPVDPFSEKKRAVAASVREIREIIRDRDALSSKFPGGNPEVVRLSAAARSRIKDVEVLIAGWDGGADVMRREIVECAKENVDYCRDLERRCYTPGASSSQPPPPSAELPDGALRAPGLGEADGDAFQVLKTRDGQIDEVVDSIAAKVHAAHHIAIEMKEIGGVQAKEIDDLAGHVDDANVSLVTVNKRLRNVLTKMRGWDKFIVDFILLCILLGVGGVIYRVVKSY